MWVLPGRVTALGPWRARDRMRDPRWWRDGCFYEVASEADSVFVCRGTSQDEDKLSQLAHAQRMNTPLRRQIFLAIMESEVPNTDPSSESSSFPPSLFHAFFFSLGGL